VLPSDPGDFFELEVLSIMNVSEVNMSILAESVTRRRE
jgi:hypothetical protein